MNLITKLFAGALLGLAILLAACDPVGLTGTDETINEPTLSPLATTSNMGIATIEYEIIDLGSLGGTYSQAYGINNIGQIVGISNNSSGENRAFLWDAVGGMRDLGISGFSSAVDINNAGQVVGSSKTTSGEVRAFLWEEASGMRDLGNLGGPLSYAKAINEAGQVVGFSYTPSFDSRAFIWEESVGMKDLGTLGGDNSYAENINDIGQVVGRSETEKAGQSTPSNVQPRAFLWDEATGLRNLGTLGGDGSIAFGINNLGHVVGLSTLASGVRSAYIWDEVSGMHILGSFGENIRVSSARVINDAGLVLGEIFTTSGEVQAFVWEKTKGTRFLPSLGGGYNRGFGINNAGQIVGASRDLSGEIHAVLWNPVQNSDTTPPVIAFETIKSSLWPPNHKMHLVLSGISATDDSDESPILNVSVTSNELLNGLGDGNTAEDWQIEQVADGSFQVYLRAERSGDGSGRVYTVTISAEDASGNVAEEFIEVSVARDMGRSM